MPCVYADCSNATELRCLEIKINMVYNICLVPGSYQISFPFRKSHLVTETRNQA